MLRQELAMTGAGPAMMGPLTTRDEAEGEVMHTRFGKVTIFRKSPITFPNGMLGMPDKFQFCLTSFPSEKLARFKLLQSLEDEALSFITLPVDVENSFIDRADIEQACRDLDVALDNVAILLVVSVQRDANGVQMSVNTRAPLFMNVSRRLAAQYVFHNVKYQIRQAI